MAHRGSFSARDEEDDGGVGHDADGGDAAVLSRVRKGHLRAPLGEARSSVASDVLEVVLSGGTVKIQCRQHRLAPVISSGRCGGLHGFGTYRACVKSNLATPLSQKKRRG